MKVESETFIAFPWEVADKASLLKRAI